jgi:hypothetical protein
MTKQQDGFTFENDTRNELIRIYTNASTIIYKESEIRAKWKQYGVDIMIQFADNTIIFIQCKWESTKPKLKDIHHFIMSSKNIINDTKPNKYSLIMLSKNAVSVPGLVALNNNHGDNIYLKDSKQQIWKDLSDHIDKIINTTVNNIPHPVSPINNIAKLITPVTDDDKKKAEIKQQIIEIETKINNIYTQLQHEVSYIQDYEMKLKITKVVETQDLINIIIFIKQLYQDIKYADKNYYCVHNVFGYINAIELLENEIKQLKTKKTAKLSNLSFSDFDRTKAYFAEFMRGNGKTQNDYKKIKNEGDITKMRNEINESIKANKKSAMIPVHRYNNNPLVTVTKYGKY